MGYKTDLRGSKDQKLIYQFLSELYPNYEVIYEFPLYDIGQRLDIYIPNLALAVEYDGRQHVDFIEHFHKNLEGFKDAQKMDQQKNEYLLLNGIKLVRILYNEMVANKEELLERINSIPYPDFPYNPLPEESEKQISFKENMREQRKDFYKKNKNLFKEDPEIKKERLEKERQFRKERYKKIKENK